jgi:hypothetical protein
MGNCKIPKKKSEYKIPWKKTCGKTTAEMGRQHHEGLLVAAEDGGDQKKTEIFGGELLKRPGNDKGCRTIEEYEEEE